MVKRILIIGMVFVFLFSSIVNISIGLYIKIINNKKQTSNLGNILYVGGDGPGNYTTIQDAINASSDGDTIFVYHGIYPNFAFIQKSIKLIGEDKNTTIIEGGWRVGGVRILSANNVLVSGFTVRDCGFYYSGGIDVDSDNCTITGNILINNIVAGISFYGNNNIIANNTIINNRRGISLSYGNNNLITGNVIELNNMSGIVFVEIRDPYYPSSNNIIVNNIIKNNKNGIDIQKGNNTIISNNFIINNSCGIDFHSLITNNTIIKNNTLIYNNIGVSLSDSNNNLIYHNNFINNTNQAYDYFYYYQCMNYWDKDYPIGGNFWSDYKDSDNFNGPDQDLSGRDGIGDIPYNITGNSNSKDKYPFVKPIGNEPPDPPVILGPTTGKARIYYDYNFVTSDPNYFNNVSYFVNWGDSTISNWTDFVPSGTTVILSHAWVKKATYTIYAKAKDNYNNESDWKTFDITIPRTRALYNFNWMDFVERFPTL